MTASAIYSVTPKVGWSNIVRVDDSGTVRPLIYDTGAATAFIMPDAVGLVDSGASATALPPTGRPGSLKTVFDLEILATAAGVVRIVEVVVSLPPSMTGLVPANLTTAAQWQNQANWPICDYSKFLPVCSIKNASAPNAASLDAATNPFVWTAPAVVSVPFVAAGAVAYLPAGWESEAAFLGDTNLGLTTGFSNLGAAGALICSFDWSGFAGDVVGQALECTIDFSSSVTN